MMKRIFMLLAFVSWPVFSEQKDRPWENAPPQPIYTRFQRNMPYQHDRGFFFATSLGPAWVQSIQNPAVSGVRFFGDVSIGGLPCENLAVHASLWGSFLTEASVIMAGLGLTGFIGDNWALSFSAGVGQVIGIETEQFSSFRESLLGLQIKAAKYWWVGPNTSLGVSLAAEAHGFSFLLGELSSIGFSAGPRLELVYN